MPEVHAMLRDPSTRAIIVRFLSLLSRGDQWPNLAQGVAEQYQLELK